MNKRRGGVLVGIVTFNRKAKLANTLEECRKQGFPNIVVLDNGSTDGTREFLSSQTDITAIFAEHNEGGSGGFNRIMRYFVEQTTDEWLLTFDDDAYPAFTHQSLSGYLEREDSLGKPAYAFKVTYPDGTACEMNRPGVNVLVENPLRAARRDFHVDNASGPQPVDFASFVGLLLNRGTIEKVGVVSREFFIYSDDTYYTLSISSTLGKILYCPDFVLVHDCNRSSRNLSNHNRFRLEKDIVNKLVMIREYSRFKIAYAVLYVARLLVVNPRKVPGILSASLKGFRVDISTYRNEPL